MGPGTRSYEIATALRNEREITRTVLWMTYLYEDWQKPAPVEQWRARLPENRAKAPPSGK